MGGQDMGRKGMGENGRGFYNFPKPEVLHTLVFSLFCLVCDLAGLGPGTGRKLEFET